MGSAAGSAGLLTDTAFTPLRAPLSALHHHSFIEAECILKGRYGGTCRSDGSKALRSDLRHLNSGHFGLKWHMSMLMRWSGSSSWDLSATVTRLAGLY